MKLMLAALLLLLAGCKTQEKTESANISGAYKMLSQSVKGANIDTTISALQQLKIFTDDFMMYANVNPADSISSFGVGTYTVTKDTIMENVIFSAGDSTNDDTLRQYTLLIEKTANGYKQFIPEIGTGDNKVSLTEEYTTAGDSISSPLDGVWKQVQRYEIKGTDTSFTKGIQYKGYHRGQVLWGTSWTDSLNKKHTGIGFGTFTMTGNKVKEMMKASTFSAVQGHDFDVDIEMDGKDGFKQTITGSDGTKAVEVYVRMKK